MSINKHVEEILGRLAVLESASTGGPAAAAPAAAGGPDLERWDTEVKQLSARLQELEGQVKSLPAASTAPAVAAAAGSITGGVAPEQLELRLTELHEDGVARLQEMHDKITPVLQLLVQRVKALETAGPSVGGDASSSAGAGTGADAGAFQSHVAEIKEAADALSVRVSQVEEGLSEKLNTMQSKVSSVMQLLVQRVKALEARMGGRGTGSTAGS